jgi:hypothetical protein
VRLTIADDSELVDLAAPRAAELFPLLRQTAGFWPLLVLLAVLPSLYALEHHALSDSDALWGLRSFELLSAKSLTDLVDPPADALTTPLRWQPPLGFWLMSAVMRIVGPSQTAALYVVSYAATAGLIAGLYFLCRTASGPRLASWTALLAAFHGPLLAQAAEPAPHALSLMFAVGTFWGYLAHLQDGSNVVSVKLLGAGISLGLCILAGGPLGLAIVAVALLYVLGFRGEGGPAKRALASQKRRAWVGWPPLRSLLVLCLTGFAASGWWVLMEASRHGIDFWQSWFGVSADPQIVRIMAERGAGELWAVDRLLSMTGVLCGLSLLGILYGCMTIFTSEIEEERRSMQFWCAWLSCAFVVWLSLSPNPVVSGHVVSLWELFLTIPLLVGAAIGIDRIDRRQVGFLAAVAVIVLSVLAILAAPLTVGAWRHPELAYGWVAFVVALAAAAWWLYRYRRNREVVRRLILAGLVVSVVMTNAGLGLAKAGGRDESRSDDVPAPSRADNRSLESLRAALSVHSFVQYSALIAAEEAPPRLRYIVQTSLPRSRLVYAPHWDAALSMTIPNASETGAVVCVVEWGARDTRLAAIPVRGLDATPIGAAQLFEGRQLRAYLLVAPSR